MQENKADQGYRKFWPLMKSMTWKERIQHIFYYYAKYALLAAFLIYLCISLAVDVFTPSPTALLSGATVNVSISEEMKLTLVEDAFEAMGGTDRNKQVVSLSPYTLTGTVLDSDDAFIEMQGQIRAYAYHYVIMDQKGYEMLKAIPAFSPLTMVLSEEKLAYLEDRLVMGELGGETVPLAIDITDTALAAHCTYKGGKLYLSFPVGEETVSSVEPFLNYLIAQGLLDAQ